MTCTHCGTVAEPGDGFCRGCGRGLISATAAPVAADATAQPTAAPVHATPAPDMPGAAGAARWGEPGTRPFLYQGAWYSRTGETVYRYDAAVAQWVAQPPASVPYFMRRPLFTSLRTPSLILYALFALFGLCTILAVVSDVYQYTTFQRSADGESVALTKLEGARDFFDVAHGLQSLFILAIPGVFIWWTRRATCNVRALGAERPEFSPGWAIGWWFIPFANWVQPLRVVNQAWRASDPALPASEGDHWRQGKLSPLVPIWWVAYLAGNFTWGIPISLIDDDSRSQSELPELSLFAMATDVWLAVAAGLAVIVVAQLTARQDRANRKFDLAAAQEAA
jgi:hypothetical protein